MRDYRLRQKVIRSAPSAAAIVFLAGVFFATPATAQRLGDALEQAWSRHPQAVAIGERKAEAQARAEVADEITPGPPSLSLSNLNDRLNRNRGKQEWELELAVPLWLPGQKAARQQVATGAIGELDARRNALRLQVAGELREAWWTIAAARNAVDLAERREATAQALEADVQRRFRLGELARTDANLARNERLAASGELLAARSALRQTEQSYRRLTGSDAPAILAEEKPAAPNGAGDAHPQLAAAIAAAELARARLKVAQETLRDAPEFAVRVVRERGDFGEPYANSVGVKLTLPFSSGARVRQENAAARAESVQADAELALLRQRIELDTARTRLELAVAEHLLSQAQERQQVTADNLRLAEKSFSLGESDLPSVLRARSNAFEAEASLGQQRIARAASMSRLNQTLGVLP